MGKDSKAMDEAKPLLELAHISKRYDSPAGGDGLLVLKDVSLRLAGG